MDDPNEENIESSWIMINTIDIAEEATTLNHNENLEDSKVYKNHDNIESDVESDGISVISESSHLHESNNEEENFMHNVYEKNDKDDAFQRQSIDDPVSTECASQPKTEPKMNWTYVDSEPRSPMASSNQFYLNCLQEPIQELCEHELGSVQSDLESDGISIISDCESLNDFTDNEKKLNEEILSKENCHNERLELASKLPPAIKKYCNGVLIGTILLATSSVFLGHYFNSAEQIEEELPIYNEEYKSEIKENLAEKINEKYEVPTALAYCQERHKSDDIFMEYNVNKCLKQINNRLKQKEEIKTKKEEIKKIAKYLKIKERYLEEKEQFLIEREYELLKEELRLNQKNLMKTKSNEKENIKELNKNLNDFKKVVDVKKEKETKININEKRKKIKERHKDIKDKIKYYKSKSYDLNNLHRSKKAKNFDAHKNLHYTWKHKKEKNSSYNLNKNEKNSKKHRSHKESEKTTNENIITENYKNKKIENLHFSNSEDSKYDKLKERKIRAGTNYIILEKNNDNQTVSGYWVGKLYKGRSDIRNKMNGGDWYFDRASYRKTKRDKAKWYFDWMMDREILRYKRSFYI